MTQFALALKLLVAVASTAQAAIDFPLSSDHAWQSQTEGDVRSPCPFINTLANHGLIPRSGKDVDIFEMSEMLATTFDLDVQLFNILAAGAIEFNFTTTNEDGTVVFDIDTLFAHNKQEHDASFVRVDEFYGKEKSKLPDDGLLRMLLEETNPESTFLTKADLMTFQKNRILDSRTNNPEVSITEGQATSFAAQATFLLTLEQSSDLESVKKDKLEEMLRFERLPDGYVPTNFSHDVLAEGTVANTVLGEFLESFEAARVADVVIASSAPGEAEKEPTETSEEDKDQTEEGKEEDETTGSGAWQHNSVGAAATLVLVLTAGGSYFPGW